MDRRSYLGGVVACTLVGGCLEDGGGSTSPPTPGVPGDPLGYENHQIAHINGVTPAVAEGGLTETNGDGEQTYATLVIDREGVDRFDWGVVTEGEHGDSEGETRAFVENANFEDQFLVVFQCFVPTTTDRFAVDGVGRTDDGIAVVGRIHNPQGGGGGAVTLVTSLIRVDLDGGTGPETASVEIHDHAWFDGPHTTTTRG